MTLDAAFSRLGIRPIYGKKFTPMTEAEVVGIENQIKVRLPDTYREFLKTYGVAAFTGPDDGDLHFHSECPLPPSVSSNENGPFNFFYGDDHGKNEGYSLRVRLEYYQGRMPDSMIPIGGVLTGSQICLGVKGDDQGKVFYWCFGDEPLDEETYLEDYGEPMSAEAKRANVTFIASSFERFVNSLLFMTD